MTLEIKHDQIGIRPYELSLAKSYHVAVWGCDECACPLVLRGRRQPARHWSHSALHYDDDSPSGLSAYASRSRTPHPSTQQQPDDLHQLFIHSATLRRHFMVGGLA